MSLEGNSNSSKEAFIEAMRERLGDDGNNVEDENVKLNLGALGQAVYDILAIAETTSDESSDTAFWDWIQSAHALIRVLRQEAIARGVPEENLPSIPVNAPTSLRGRIE